MAYIHFEVDDYLDEATTDDLVKELRRRDSSLIGMPDNHHWQLLADLIACGDTQEALSLLHQLAPVTYHPKTTLYLNGFVQAQQVRS